VTFDAPNSRDRRAAITSPKHQANATNTTDAVDYDRLMQANVSRVFSERDAAKRLNAIRELYAEDATLYEPQSSARGHVAICDAVSALLASLPANFAFIPAAPAVGHHGVGRINWRSGPPGAPPAVTGTDVARCQGGHIQSLHVFLDPGKV
jgi:hypothetical protein